MKVPKEVPMHNIEHINLAEYNKAEIKEMLGPDNVWFTGLEVGHDPSKEEAIWHYIRNGGPANFRKKWEEFHKKQGSVQN